MKGRIGCRWSLGGRHGSLEAATIQEGDLMARAVSFNLTPARWAIPDQRWTKPLRKRGWLCDECRSPSPEMVRDCTAVLLIETPERPMVANVRPMIEVIHHKILELADWSRWSHGRAPCWVSKPESDYRREPDWCERIPFDAFFCSSVEKVGWASSRSVDSPRCPVCGAMSQPRDPSGDKIVVPPDRADAPMWMTTTGWTLFSEPVAEAIGPALGRRYRPRYFEILFE